MYITPASAIPGGAPAPSDVRRASTSGGVHRAKADRDREACASGWVLHACANLVTLGLGSI